MAERLTFRHFSLPGERRDVYKRQEWSLRNGYPPYLKSLAEDADIKADATVNALSSISEFGFSFAPGIKSVKQVNNDILFPMIEKSTAAVMRFLPDWMYRNS